MEIINVNGQNFEEEVIKSEKPVLIDFYADWCGPCKMLSPIIDEIAEEKNGEYKVGKINIDQNQELAMKFNVMSIPTIIIFKDGKPEKTFVGVRSKSEILDAMK